MLEDLASLAAGYAAMQHEAVLRADDASLRRHIRATLMRCLPPQVFTPEMTEDCFRVICRCPDTDDPMHTGAIHAWAGQFLRDVDAPAGTLLHRLQHSAVRLLPTACAAVRDDIRLVALDALYQPGLLPDGMHLAFLKHRLGLNGIPRLSCEEIALRMHHPLTYIHELESAILTILSSHHNGGSHA